MCGRFTQLYTWEELHGLYELGGQTTLNLEPRYNVTPTQTIDVVLPAERGGQTLARARWGLVPVWWKKELRELPATFNARAETVAEKPMFRSAFKARRCIIPASGFYEWTGPKGERQPHYITRKDGRPMSLAGLWERWKSPEGEELLSATIVVGPASEWMEAIHDRMPVILEPEDVAAWLQEPRADLMRPAPLDLLMEWKVTPRMNSNRYYEADAIEPI